MTQIPISTAISQNQLWIEDVQNEYDMDQPFYLLRRKLPSGRVINIDLTHGIDICPSRDSQKMIKQLRRIPICGIAHFNMINSDNRVENLKWVSFIEAVKLLDSFIE